MLFGVVVRCVVWCAAVLSRFVLLSPCCPVAPSPRAAALVVWLRPASCQALPCPAVRVVLCRAALVLLRVAARFCLCCCRCLVLWCVGVRCAVSFGVLWCRDVALLCGVVPRGALAWFAVFFCAVLCFAGVVLACCLVCYCAVLLLAAPSLLVSCCCRAGPCCAVLFGAVLHRVWCRRVLLRPVVFPLALCGFAVRCVVRCAVVPCRFVLVLPCCQALPAPPCCCPCCLAAPCVLASCSVSCCACGAVVR